MSIDSTNDRTAVVAGLCSHGLAVCRALARRGIPTIALESNPSLPGYFTKSARVVTIPEVNAEGLVDSLRELGQNQTGQAKPVLFLTNDNMVRIVGENWAVLSDFYELSWSNSRHIIVQLLDKSFCERFLRDRNYPLPGTWVFANQETAVRIPDAIRFPVIAKPSHPLGQFKANRVDDKQGLVALVAAHPGTPMVIQEWIPGGDEDIFFCATVAKNGKPMCFFDGVKYLSHPPARGQTVVAGPADLPDLRKLLIRFVADANLDGPVSIEAKRDPRGEMRIIEPTVGRTDFWAKLAITNGIDLPYYEYLSVTSPPLDIVEHRPRIQKIWFDSEKDPASFIRLFARICRKKGKFWLPSFCYLDLKDWQPFWKSMAQLLARTRRYLERRLGISRVTNTSNK